MPYSNSNSDSTSAINRMKRRGQNQPPDDYNLSRAAMRDRFGSRRIDATPNQSALDTTPSGRAAYLKQEGLAPQAGPRLGTSEADWRAMFPATNAGSNATGSLGGSGRPLAWANISNQVSRGMESIKEQPATPIPMEPIQPGNVADMLPFFQNTTPAFPMQPLDASSLWGMGRKTKKSGYSGSVLDSASRWGG